MEFEDQAAVQPLSDHRLNATQISASTNFCVGTPRLQQSIRSTRVVTLLQPKAIITMSHQIHPTGYSHVEGYSGVNPTLGLEISVTLAFFQSRDRKNTTRPHGIHILS